MQVAPGYYPHPSGGTEAYVASLARQLDQSGEDVLIAAPTQDGQESAYMYGGIHVARFRIASTPDPKAVYGNGDPTAASHFGRLLDETHPDIVHLHAFSPATSLRALREASLRGIPTIYTFHHPATTCLRSTLMRWGTEVCDGRIDLDRCTACKLQSLGMPRLLSEIVGRVPIGVGKSIAASGFTGSLWTALRARELTVVFQQSFTEYMATVDHIVLVSEWVRPILLRNGVSPEKVSLSRQALPFAPFTVEPVDSQIPADRPPVRLAMLTRATPVKGVDVILEAMARIPEADIRLDIFAVVQSNEDSAYLENVKRLSRHDSRIRFCSALAHEKVVDTLRQYHLLVIPSQWLEVAPLVILEAFAAGTPVLGSNRGGIAEMVRDEANGLLVQADSADRWAAAFLRLTQEQGLIGRLRSGIKRPRDMHDVADDMVTLYRTLMRNSA
jgi:glycosyltransferase involved in cell wall biosynthesis